MQSVTDHKARKDLQSLPSFFSVLMKLRKSPRLQYVEYLTAVLPWWRRVSTGERSLTK